MERVVGSARRVAQELPVSTVLVPACLAYAREVYGRWRRFSAATLALELGVVESKWAARGLRPDVLAAIQAAVLAVLGGGIQSEEGSIR